MLIRMCIRRRDRDTFLFLRLPLMVSWSFQEGPQDWVTGVSQVLQEAPSGDKLAAGKLVHQTGRSSVLGTA